MASPWRTLLGNPRRRTEFRAPLLSRAPPGGATCAPARTSVVPLTPPPVPTAPPRYAQGARRCRRRARAGRTPWPWAASSARGPSGERALVPLSCASRARMAGAALIAAPRPPPQPNASRAPSLVDARGDDGTHRRSVRGARERVRAFIVACTLRRGASVDVTVTSTLDPTAWRSWRGRSRTFTSSPVSIAGMRVTSPGANATVSVSAETIATTPGSASPTSAAPRIAAAAAPSSTPPSTRGARRPRVQPSPPPHAPPQAFAASIPRACSPGPPRGRG